MTILSTDVGFFTSGPINGEFSFIIIIGGCNLRCPGYGSKYKNYKNKIVSGCPYYPCVDKHTFGNNWGKIKDFEELKRIINNSKLPKGVKYNLVFTGGEPLLYWGSPFFQSIIKGAILTGHKVIIETNATIDIAFEYDYQKEIWFSQSIKVFSSGETKTKAINTRTLRTIKRNAKNKFYRILTSELTWEEDYRDIKEILIEKLNIPPNNIWLIPIKGDQGKDYLKNHIFVNKKALKYGFNISK